MAKKKTSNLSQNLISVLLIAVGIYFVILGVLGDMSQSWQTFCIAFGLALQTSGTIRYAKLN